MYENVKNWLRIYSIVVLFVVAARMFKECKSEKSFTAASLLLTIVYLLNI